MWQRLFGKRRDLRGATLTLGDRVYTVVGVMPRGALWSPILVPQDPAIEDGGVSATFVRPMVRLRPGVTREEADRELKTLARELTERYGAQEAPFAFELNPVLRQREELRDIHKAMVGAALAVLLIACVNLAHLMLARGLAKRRELALRMAVGASRAAVVRQMFLECAVVTAVGLAVGVVVALWGADVLRNRMPPEVQWIGLVQPRLSWRVFALAGLAAAISAVLFGLLPALRVALDVNLDEPLKDDAGTTTGRVRRRYSPLVISEVALALALMMGGGLLLRTVHQLRREDAGLDVRTLYRAFFFSRARSDTLAERLREDVITTVRGVPGVIGVALSTGRTPRGGAVTAEMGADSTRTITSQSYDVVTPDVFEVLRLPILRGRNFEPGDGVGSGVAIIDPIAAQRLYPNQDPIGRMIKLGSPASNAPWVPIVGIVRNPKVLDSWQQEAPQAHVFVARADSAARGNLLIRIREPNPRFTAQAMARLKEMRSVGGLWVMPYDFQRQGELASRGFLARVFVAMGIVALALAALGLYGVLAYAVSRRRREFAVRLALGAEPRGLLKMVLHDGLVMLLAGIGAGAFVALATARTLDAVLIAVLPSDVISLVASEAVLIAVGVAAALEPARRASRANPLDILRAT
jgi:putative ABC transport system permease protein